MEEGRGGRRREKREQKKGPEYKSQYVSMTATRRKTTVGGKSRNRTLILVQPSQVTVVPLVQSLILECLKSLLVDLLENDSEGVVSPLEDGREGDVKVGVTGLGEVLATFLGFGTAFVGQGGVLPAVCTREAKGKGGSALGASESKSLSPLTRGRRRSYSWTPAQARTPFRGTVAPPAHDEGEICVEEKDEPGEKVELRVSTGSEVAQGQDNNGE